MSTDPLPYDDDSLANGDEPPLAGDERTEGLQAPEETS